MNTQRPYHRHLENPLIEALEDTPVVVLQGARQVGKSTLASLLAADRKALMVTLDDPSTLAVAGEDPAFFVSQATGFSAGAAPKKLPRFACLSSCTASSSWV